MVRVLGIVDGRLTCINPERGLHQEWKRAATPALTPAGHLAQIKQKEAGSASMKSVRETLLTSREEEKGTVQLRGTKGYVEPRIDYCTRIARFRPIRDGLITYPSWKRQDFSALLKMWCVDSPEDRHSRAAYAFNLDGTPTSEYEKALSIYAEQRMDVVLGHSRDYALKAGREASRPGLRLATDPARSGGVQKQQISSQIHEDEEEEADEDKEEDEEADEEEDDGGDEEENEEETEEENEQSPWHERLEMRAKSVECWKRHRESVRRARGLSPEPQRTFAEVKRKKHKSRG